MRYFLTDAGLVPITMPDDELFAWLCDYNGGEWATRRAKRYFDILLDDENTVFRNPAVQTNADLFECIATLGRINVQATMVFSDNFEEVLQESTAARVILEITFTGGYTYYSANVSLVSQDFMNTLTRKAIIDALLENL